MQKELSNALLEFNENLREVLGNFIYNWNELKLSIVYVYKLKKTSVDENIEHIEEGDNDVND